MYNGIPKVHRWRDKERYVTGVLAGLVGDIIRADKE